MSDSIPNEPGRFTVYHLMPEFAREAYFTEDVALDHFTLVATVDAPALGAVFELTNHIESNWTDNAAVLELFTPKNRTRSTSVGDIVSDERGRFYRVEGCGWKDVTAAVMAQAHDFGRRG